MIDEEEDKTVHWKSWQIVNAVQMKTVDNNQIFVSLDDYKKIENKIKDLHLAVREMTLRTYDGLYQKCQDYQNALDMIAYNRAPTKYMGEKSKQIATQALEKYKKP